MALSAVEKQAIFIQNLNRSVKDTTVENLPPHDLSEVQDLILRKTKAILGTSSRINPSQKQKHYNCDQSETDTVLLT